MTVTSQPGASVLDSMLNAESTRNEIGITLLKKAQNVEKQQGAALVELLEKSAVSPQGLDTYA